MYGQSVGQLEVFCSQGGQESLVFSTSGGQGPRWLSKKISLPQGPLKVQSFSTSILSFYKDCYLIYYI